jgi:hypothetical protein
MTTPLTVECHLDLRRTAHGRKEMRAVAAPPAPPVLGRIPRVSRLLALAIRFEGLVRSGAISNYAALARLGQVTEARISQIIDRAS